MVVVLLMGEYDMNNTHWDNVAGWYDSYLEHSSDTYQDKVIAPNMLRMLGLTKNDRVLDVACGQGYFARLVAKAGAIVVGFDQSKELITKASERKGENETYLVGNAETIDALKLRSFDLAYSVLAFENIKNIGAVLTGVAGVLKKEGKFVLVLLHPAFRIPQHSDWGYDSKKAVQYRKVEKYLSEVSIPIELSPFKGAKKETTTTFHRSLQWYTKAFKNAGFAITTMEEWISHKKSQPGPRQAAEDAARKEFPLFLALELKKL